MNYKKIVMAMGMAMLIAGCNTQPIVNVTDQPVVTAAGKPPAADLVRIAISITCKDSTNLKFRDGQIHKACNAWIATLDRDVRNELLRI